MKVIVALPSLLAAMPDTPAGRAGYYFGIALAVLVTLAVLIFGLASIVMALTRRTKLPTHRLDVAKPLGAPVRDDPRVDALVPLSAGNAGHPSPGESEVADAIHRRRHCNAAHFLTGW